MAWVERRDGTIVGVYNNRQPGYAEEELADDHIEVVAYRAPKPAPSDKTAALAQRRLDDARKALGEGTTAERLRAIETFLALKET